LQYHLLNIRENPAWLDRAADYFSSKWSVSRQVYHDSMADSISTKAALPRWYLLMDGDTIIGSFGLIENDFMVRKELMPWLCALYIEEHMRGKELGALLLEKGRQEAAELGFTKLYLCTDHVGYYEKNGWRFFGLEEHESGGMTRVYVVDTASPIRVTKMDYQGVYHLLQSSFPDFIIDDYEEGQPYDIGSGFALYLLEKYLSSATDTLVLAGEFFEQLYSQGDERVDALVTIGYLDAIQNIWGSHFVDPEEMSEYLGDLSQAWWCKLKDYWDDVENALGDYGI